MKKFIPFLLAAGLTLTACSEENDQATVVELDKPKQEQNEKVTDKKESVKKEEKKEEIVPFDKTAINNMLQLDPDDKQYNNGKFELKDGTLLNADYLMYVDTDVSKYASIIFYENQIASVLLDPSDKSKEEILEYFHLQDVYKDYTVNEFTKVIRIIVDERFDPDNISVLPSEWD